jgi:hypothetical protein
MCGRDIKKFWEKFKNLGVWGSGGIVILIYKNAPRDCV